jgi:hypothetical protein
MISRVHNRLGTGGMIVAVVALVAALTGGAYAASGGLTAKQKKQVKKIARTEAQKFSGAGPQGPVGPQGPPGAPGQTGANGVNGKSVVIDNESQGVHCAAGGLNIEVEGSGTKKYVCNGQTGFVEALPSDNSLKGVWSAADKGELTPMLVPISFDVEVSPAPTLVYIDESGAFAITVKPDGTPGFLGEESAIEALCPGSAAAPEAEPGYLCIYVQKAEKVETATSLFIGGWATPTKFGASIPLTVAATEDPALIRGTWAVTAE